MAIIEIAKIQVRRGQENQTGVPQLDGGEFAWAADTEKLYIGLRRDDGGSRNANVEILTENHLKNFFSVSFTTSSYIYREGSVNVLSPLGGITAEDGSEDEWVRSIQSKLDDTVSAGDFGIDANTTTWNLRRLQLAIDRLFLNTGRYSQNPGKKLYFPSGTYYITGTVYIPAGTTIVGDGIGKTVFVLTTNTDALFKTCDLTSAGGVSGYKTFDSGGGAGADFSSTSSAKHVRIEDVTLMMGNNTTSSTATSLISLDCADNSVIKSVEFVGNYSTGTGAIANPKYVGINIRGKTAEGTNENSLVHGCVFRNMYAGVLSNHDIRTTTIEHNDFKELVRGVNFNAENEGALVGPRFIKITDNQFDLIEEQGIYVGTIGTKSTSSYVISQHNYFERVGNYNLEINPAGDLGQTGTAIISFLTDANSSYHDHFRRWRIHNENISNSDVYYNPLVKGNAVIENGWVFTATIGAGVISPLFRLPITSAAQHINVKYVGMMDNIYSVIKFLDADAVNTSTILVSNTAGIRTNMLTLGLPGIPADTYVIGIALPNIVTLDKPITGANGSGITFRADMDVLGDLTLHLQDKVNPDQTLFDNRSFMNWDGSLTFSCTVNSTGSYFTILGNTAPYVTRAVWLEMQTKITT